MGQVGTRLPLLRGLVFMPASNVLEKWIFGHVVAILAGTTWVWAGWRFTWMPPIVWASVTLSLLLLLTPWFARARTASSHVTIWWLRDALFFWGLLFLGYLALQWWNAGRIRVYDPAIKRWIYSAPSHHGWPSAIDRSEAAQMLQWFFPAWALAMAVRCPFFSGQGLKRLFLCIAYGAGLLALFGLILYLSGTHSMYWIVPVDAHFFASFAYQNHASAYFVLVGALDAGLMYHELFRTDQPRKHSRIALLSVTLVLCLTGANLALSRAGVILAWALGCFLAIYGLLRGWRDLPPVARMNLAAVTVATFCIFYFAVAGFGSKAIQQEFTPLRPAHHIFFPVLNNVDLALSDRPLLAKISWTMWQDNPLFGVGGWGFRHLLSHYVPEDMWGWVRFPGRANVHCDPLQFLVEFGAVGYGLMTAALATLVIPLFQKRSRHSVLLLMPVIGILLVVVFSLIDLPFRCPAILFTWVVILAALPRLVHAHRKNSVRFVKYQPRITSHLPL